MSTWCMWSCLPGGGGQFILYRTQLVATLGEGDL